MYVRIVTRPEEFLSASDLGLPDSADDAVQAAVQFLDGPHGYLGSSLGRQTIEAVYPQWCEATEYMLPLGPIIEVNSVKYMDTANVEQTLDPVNYYLLGERLIFTWSPPGATVYRKPDAVRVNYDAGYDEDEHTGPLPAPIAQAIAILANHMTATNAEAAAGGSLKSIDIPGVMRKSYGGSSSGSGGEAGVQAALQNLVSGYVRKPLIW